MRRFLIAALFGAPLLIAGPAFAAVGKTHASPATSSELAGAGAVDLRLVEAEETSPAPLQVAHRSSNPLWWLQVGVGNQWRDGHRHRQRHDHQRHGWHKGHGKHGKHWNRHRQHSRHWDHRRHDHDRDRHHRRHRDRDYDRDRDHRGGHGHHRR